MTHSFGSEPVKDADDHWQDGYEFGRDAVLTEVNLLINRVKAVYGDHTHEGLLCDSLKTALRGIDNPRRDEANTRLSE